MTSALLAIMAICMPASTMSIIDTPGAVYAHDCECRCANCGCIGGVWLNHYSPCRCDTTIVSAEPFPLPPLRENSPDPRLRLLAYAPSLNLGYFGGPHSVFAHPLLAPQGHLLNHPRHEHLLDDNFLDQMEIFDVGTARFSDIGLRAPSASAAVPGPATLVLLVVGMAVAGGRRRRSTA